MIKALLVIPLFKEEAKKIGTKNKLSTCSYNVFTRNSLQLNPSPLNYHHAHGLEVWAQEKTSLSLVWAPGWIVPSLAPFLQLFQHDSIWADITFRVMGKWSGLKTPLPEEA